MALAREFLSKSIAFFAILVVLTAGCSQSRPPKNETKTEIKDPDKKDTASKPPDDFHPEIKVGKIPATPKSIDDFPIEKHPRFTEKVKFFSIPVYFGTNRRPRATYDVNFRDEFVGFFESMSGWWFGGLLAIAWLAPLALSRSSETSIRSRNGKAFGALVLIGAIAASGVLAGWRDAVILAVATLLSFAIVNGVLRSRIARTRMVVASSLWLLSVVGLAAATAHFRAESERHNPAAHFGNLASSRVEYGRSDVTVPASYLPGSGAIPRPDVVLGIELPEDPAKHVVLAKLDSLEEYEFFRAVRGEVERPENRAGELFLFVHGYNNTFRDAMFRAALIARDLEFPGPALAYSWPSRGEVEDYPADTEAVDYAIAPLKEFIAKIAQHSGARRIYLFAHSMGSRAMMQALRELYASPWSDGDAIKEVVLAAPDIPQNKFRDQILPAVLGKVPRMTLYASSHDVALATSKAVNKETRAGQGGPYVVVVKGLDTVDASDLAKPIFDLGHNYAFGTPTLRRDLQLLFQGKLPPRETLKNAKREELTYWIVDSGPPR